MANAVSVDFVTKVVEIEINDNKTESLSALAAINAAKRADEASDLVVNNVDAALAAINTKAEAELDEINDFANTKKDELQSYVNDGETILKAVRNEYGYPFTAATAAAMTDTSKIYVYTGSETGYVNGNWYYHNGTAWVSGGVYNSTAFETDKTLSVADMAADAKEAGKTKDALLSLLHVAEVKKITFSTGMINTANGEVEQHENFNTRFISTAILVRKGDIITFVDGYQYVINYYKCENGWVYEGHSYTVEGWIKDAYRVIDYDGVIVLVVRKGDNETLAQEDLDALNYNVIQYSSAVKKDEIYFDIGFLSTNGRFHTYIGNDYMMFTKTSEPAIVKNTYCRYRTANRITMHKGARISIADGYRYWIATFSSETGNADGTLGYWLTTDTVFTEETVVKINVDVVATSDQIPYYEWPDIHSIIKIENNPQIISLTEDVDSLKNEEKTVMRVGELINGHYTASGVVDDTFTPYRLSTKETVALPFGSKTKMEIKINPKYRVGFRSGADSRNVNHTTDWLNNGDVVTFPDGDNYYTITVRNGKSDKSDEIHPSEVEAIGLELFAQKADGIVSQNDEACKILSSAKLFFSSSQLNTLNKYPVIAHTSDCHGDYTRVERFLDFCDTCGVDVGCVTGDIVAYKPAHQIKWFQDILLKHDTLPAICTGNHDVYDSEMEDSDIYDFMFDDIAEKIGNTTGETWYYKDITEKQLRIISVNLFQYGGTDRWKSHYTDGQLSWLVNTLASTPNGYGIIMLSHAPQVSLDNAKDANYPDFYQNTRLSTSTFNDVDGVPIYDIVDAFISRTTLSQTYSQTGSPASVSVSADFTSVDSSIEFIAHLTGHLHQDSICYIPNRTNKQLMLNVTCTNAIYGGSAYPYLCDVQDQARNNTDASQDAFNVYVVDRDNKTVKVVRIGSNVTYQMVERKYMEIPYAD